MRLATCAAIAATLACAACASGPDGGISINQVSRDGITLTILPFSYSSGQAALAAAATVAQKHCREVANKNARFLFQEPNPPVYPLSAHYACDA